MMSNSKINLFFHCKQCVAERPDDVTPEQFSRLSVGWTDVGVQVWCFRHDINVVNLDFMGQKVRATGE
jgi:hypothetical protein